MAKYGDDELERRMEAEIADSFDEELEMEIDDERLEKLLDEEEEIARRTHGAANEAPHFRGED